MHSDSLLNGANETNKINRSAERNGHNLQQATVPLSIIIVGAGLGGLAAAISLARRGHSVTVLEQAPELGEVILSFITQPQGAS
jgi:NADPH-dependent 2,4-dienoyl-CoA reductase/sulfur reductase-like enzyme